MLIHVVRVTVATSVVVLCMFLPYLPGGYDSLAAPLSLMAQLFGWIGLLLVPAGALCLASERFARARRAAAILALVASILVALGVSLAALIGSGVSLGLLTLAACAAGIAWGARRLRTVSLDLVVVPVAVALVQWLAAEPATSFSRNRAIRNGGPLIADIERHRAANGRYPASLLSVWRDYAPGIVGIEAYRYEPSGEAYNLVFEQPTFILGTREFVVYNPRDENTIISHAIDRLQMTPDQLAVERTRGHYAVHDAPQPHWKYFWFD